MTDEAQHDPLPYILDGLDITTPEDSGFAIIAHVNPDTKDGGKSRGEFIVRACNNHYGLLEALELTIKWAELHGLDKAPLISGHRSRRKAPIYWLLQSSKKNYALWLYYHRLDKDMLFKALVNYVEPKIRLEEGRLEPLRAQRAEAGASGKGVKKLEKEIAQQEEFISELQDFEGKLRRVANLHLDPDLNDGVVLNIAPLREIVPWKEAQKYWDELLDGKYAWSSIGRQLRQLSLVRSP